MEHGSHTWLSWSPVQRALIMVLPHPHCPQPSFSPSISQELYRVLKTQASVENHPHFLCTGSRHINNDVNAVRVFTEVWSKQYGICLWRLMKLSEVEGVSATKHKGLLNGHLEPRKQHMEKAKDWEKHRSQEDWSSKEWMRAAEAVLRGREDPCLGGLVCWGPAAFPSSPHSSGKSSINCKHWSCKIRLIS